MITEDDCQYWKNLEEMTLSSPDYPKWIRANGFECQWLLSAPKGFVVALEFIEFGVSNLLHTTEVKILHLFSLISYMMIVISMSCSMMVFVT